MTFNKRFVLSSDLLEEEEGQEVISVITDSDFEDDEKRVYPESLPILPLRNTVMYPGVVFPVTVGRDKSIRLIKDAYKKNRIIGVVAQKDQETEDPQDTDIYTTGTLAHIIKMFKMPDGNTTVIIQGKRKFEIQSLSSTEPYLRAKVNYIQEDQSVENEEVLALIDNIRDIASRIVEISPNIPTEANFALKNINVDIPAQKVTAFISPSGCGKSTLLRCFNRMNELITGATIEGSIELEGENIYDPRVDVAELRRRVGMVFQRPNPFPKTVYENVAYGLKIQGEKSTAVLDQSVEWALRSAALWEEVRDRLHESALSLSGGQQQRLVIARAIAVKPSVLLLDEPASALDPISTLKIEELVHQLKDEYTIVIVTHNMQQAARCSDRTAFFFEGKIIEEGATDQVFTRPKEKQTEDYVTGKFG